jgi:hypothetical protein
VGCPEALFSGHLTLGGSWLSTCHRNYFESKRNRKIRLAVDYVQNATATSEDRRGPARSEQSKTPPQILTAITLQQSLGQGFLKLAR